MMWQFILLVICLLPNTAQAEWKQEGFCNISRTSNKGKEFFLAAIYDKDGQYDVKLFVSSTETVSISIENPNNSFSPIHIINTAGTQEVTIDRSIEQSVTGINNKIIFISSSAQISVHGLRNNQMYLAEAFTALPIEALSTTYVVSSYNALTTVYIIIASAYDGTSVSIILNINSAITFENNVYRNGDTMHIHLERLQTFMLESASDWSGTIINSNKPISVLAGGDLEIPVFTNDQDMTLSQLVPVEHWDREFIVPPLYPSSDSLIRIYAFHPNTSVSIRNKTHSKTRNLTRGTFLEEVAGKEPILVNSSQPISVVQYAFSGSHDRSSTGDPLMMIIPGIHQFSSDYLFPTKIDRQDVKHYASVIIKNNTFHGLRLDGYLPGNITFPVHFNEEDYVVAVQELTGPFHSLTHTDSTVKFGALVYGFGTYLGYGFPAGFEFTETASCKTTPIALPTAGSFSKENNIVCFSCTDMTHLKYCDLIEKCADNLGCFVERNQIGSRVRYNSGCVKSYIETCATNNNVPGRCSRCCKTSYCNSHGCGDDGFGSSDSRGPLCYDCQHLSDPSECVNILQCAHEEFCYIEEHLWGDNDKVYSIGCRPKYHCRLATSLLNPEHAIIGRSLSTCSECCEGDFCNTNCTALALTPIIG